MGLARLFVEVLALLGPSQEKCVGAKGETGEPGEQGAAGPEVRGNNTIPAILCPFS